MTQDPEDRPIRDLASLETDVSPQFVNVVRQRIQRRTTAAQLANFSWTLPGVILLEFLGITRHLLDVVDGRKSKPQ